MSDFTYSYIAVNYSRLKIPQSGPLGDIFGIFRKDGNIRIVTIEDY